MVAWIILVPLGSALAAYLAGRRGHPPIAVLSAGGLLVLSYYLALEIWLQGPKRYLVGGWEAPLGINLYVDGFSALMVVITAVVGGVVTVYGLSFFSWKRAFSTPHERTMFWPLWLFLWASLNALFLSADVFNMYVLFELIGLSAIGMVALTGKQEALLAAMRYFLAAMLGSLCFLMGVSLLYALHGTLDIFLLGEQMTAGHSSRAAFALMTIGLLLKTALFPLHFWLPSAHASASAPVSALLSALVVKASFFVLVRLWFEVFGVIITVPIGQMLGAMGAAAIVWGSFQALRQRRLKLLIAHSTVAQIGYLFLLFPLTVPLDVGEGPAAWFDEAWSGITYQVLAHALAKASMFLTAGVVLAAYGTDRIPAMRGMSATLPISTFALALAGVSLMGLPPSGGFVAKWLIMKAALGSGQWWWLIFLVWGGLLTAGYVFLMLRYAFATAERVRTVRPVSLSMEIAAILLALVAVFIGFRLEEPLQLLEVGIPVPEGLP